MTAKIVETLRKFWGRKSRKYMLVRISLTGQHGLQVIGTFRKRRQAEEVRKELNAQMRFWDTGEIIKIREV